jgi:hypothetical protein
MHNEDIVATVVSPHMLGGKMISLDKGIEDEQPSLISDDLSFYDLHEIKDNCSFEAEDNYIQISDILTKEMEKEI